MANENSKKYLCLEVSKFNSVSCQKDSASGFGVLPFVRRIPELCKCPASPEMLMAALQFLTDDMMIQVKISDKPIDYSTSEVDK